MQTKFTQIISILAFVITTIFLIFMVNQTIQLVQFAWSIHYILGYIVALGLFTIYSVMISVPVISFVRLPRALRIPESEKSPEFKEYLQELGQRLSQNPELRKEKLQCKNRPEIELALKTLDEKANRIIQDTASTIFVSTAISQNGRLDAILVLVAQMRMVWQLIHLYHQRPHWREVFNIYINVLSTAFIVSSVEELNISEQFEPIVTSVLGSGVVSTIPGAGATLAIITNSLVEGTANAYLTLRVGLICKSYSSLIVQIDSSTIKRSASTEAATMIGKIVRDSSAEITKSIGSVMKQMGSQALTAMQQSATDGVDNVRKTMSAATGKISQTFRRQDKPPEITS